MNNFSFFTTTMPSTRKADYYLGCLDSSVYIDFNDIDNGLICLKRISFDGYGCCNVDENVKPMNKKDSMNFKRLFAEDLVNEDEFAEIIKRTFNENKDILWDDALTEYGFIDV